MAAADDILAAVGAVVTGLFPAVPVHVRLRKADGSKDPLNGRGPGDDLPCFVVACDGPEPVMACFESLLVEYPVTIDYVTAAEPNERGDDPDARAKREAVRAKLWAPALAGALTAIGATCESGPAVETAVGGNAATKTSRLVARCQSSEPRT